ncbi:MAG: HEAT repeat domain-containing protein [Cyanobacteria bacterium HKST-UBA04]|nr:HEAT repeat domain-containing protein [Cyanobacteria bacterium HKST-UBA04]
MDHDLVYVKKHPRPDNPEGVAYVVPAVGIRGKTTDKLIPHPFGNCSAEFSTLQDTIEAVHRAGYALEVDGQLYPLPDQKPVFRSVKPAAGRPATLFDTMVPVLVRMLDDNSPNVVSSAAYALGELKSTEALEPLFHCFAHEDGTVRKHVSEAMAKLGGQAEGAVRRALADKNYLVRLTAVATVAELVARDRALGLKLLEEARPLLADDNWIVRSQMAHLVGLAAHAVFSADADATA